MYAKQIWFLFWKTGLPVCYLLYQRLSAMQWGAENKTA